MPHACRMCLRRSGAELDGGGGINRPPARCVTIGAPVRRGLMLNTRIAFSSSVWCFTSDADGCLKLAAPLCRQEFRYDHCDLQAVVARFCPLGDIVFSRSNISIVKNTSLSDQQSSSQPVQVAPQHLRLKLRPRESPSVCGLLVNGYSYPINRVRLCGCHIWAQSEIFLQVKVLSRWDIWSPAPPRLSRCGVVIGSGISRRAKHIDSVHLRLRSMKIRLTSNEIGALQRRSLTSLLGTRGSNRATGRFGRRAAGAGGQVSPSRRLPTGPLLPDGPDHLYARGQEKY